MTTSLNDKPNRVTVSGDSVTVTAGSGIQGPAGAKGDTGAGGTVAFFGNFFSTETQNNASVSARNTFTLNSTVDSNGVSIVDGTKITFAAGSDGTYDLQFSAQFDKTDSGTDEVDIWISKNGTDLEWSNTVLSLVGNNAKAVPAWNWQLNDVEAGDFFQLHWWSPDSAMRVLATAAGTNPTRPAVPSLIVTVAQVTYTQEGPQGPQGATGPTGATGPQGPEGGTTTLTTKGDLLTRDASAVTRLAVSATNDWVLTADSATSTGLKWAAPAATGAPSDATYVTLSTNGTLTNERVLTAGTGITITDGGAGSTATVATSAILPTIVDAKGDLIVGTSDNNVGRLAVGANGTLLSANSAATNGVSYVLGSRWRQEDSSVYFLPMTVSTAAPTSAASTAQIATWYPFYTAKEVTVAGIGARVGTLEAGATARVGIYSLTDLNTTTFTLVADYGTLDASGTGLKVATGTTKVGPGWFLVVAWGSNHTTVRWWRPFSGLQDTPLGSPVDISTPYFGWSLSSVDYSAGLPSTATPALRAALTNQLTSSIAPAVRYA